MGKTNTPQYVKSKYVKSSTDQFLENEYGAFYAAVYYSLRKLSASNKNGVTITDVQRNIGRGAKRKDIGCILQTASWSKRVSDYRYVFFDAEEEERKRKKMESAIKEVENDFMAWLPSYCTPGTIKDIKNSYNAINALLLQKKVLPQPLAATNRIGQLEDALRKVEKVFGNKKMRQIAGKTISAYLTYLREKRSKISGKHNSTVPKEWIRFEYTNANEFARTVPAECKLAGVEIREKNWARVLMAIVEHEITKENPALRELYKNDIIKTRNNRPFFLKQDLGFVHCLQLSNGYWINVNHSIPVILERIHLFCLHCGYSKEQIVLFGIPRELRLSVLACESEIPDTAMNHVPTPIIEAIKKYYPNGIRFDGTVIKLLEEHAGVSISNEATETLPKVMFRRNDGLYFFTDMLCTSEQKMLLDKAGIYEALEKHGCIALSVLYEQYTNLSQEEQHGIRDERDFADYLLFLMPNIIRLSTVYKERIIRKATITSADAVEYAAKCVLTEIEKRGCVSQDELLECFPRFSPLLLNGLLEKCSDHIFPAYINDILCFQTAEAMGLDESIQQAITTIFGEIEELGLPANLDVVHALLSHSLGYNFRDSFCVPDDKTFRRIISWCYRGDCLHMWKFGN